MELGSYKVSVTTVYSLLSRDSDASTVGSVAEAVAVVRQVIADSFVAVVHCTSPRKLVPLPS